MPARKSLTLDPQVERLGLALTPNGDPAEAEGTLNPACTRDRNGKLLLYPRDVAKGNISRVGLVRVREEGERSTFERDGFALEPQESYEVRSQPGYGCEDPRVTFIAELDQYVMAYTAFGPQGPRIAVALSTDGIEWQRYGLMHFDKPGMHIGDDKDAAFFPEPVTAPSGRKSLAFYHRPMLHISAVDGRAAIPILKRMHHSDRESIRIAYVPFDPVLADPRNIVDVQESEVVLQPSREWGSLKVGAGTPPVRIAEGWMSLYHGVDVLEAGPRPKLRYSAGLLVHDYERPHKILYRSPKPILIPEEEREVRGIVDNVVFPTGIDPRPELGERVFDFYYGMADWSIGHARLRLDGDADEREPAESAA